jgi:hypothetical protein
LLARHDERFVNRLGLHHVSLRCFFRKVVERDHCGQAAAGAEAIRSMTSAEIMDEMSICAGTASVMRPS